MSTSPYYLFGAGGHAKVILQILEASGKSIISVYDDHAAHITLLGYPVLRPGATDQLPQGQYITAIGGNALRYKFANLYSLEWGCAIHPSAIISPTAAMGAGTVCMAGAIVNADASIGKHVILNTGCRVEHDCVLGDYVHISPGASLAGNIEVGEGTHVGVGACVIPGLKIGRWCTIGAGAVIIRSVPDGATVVGNPGRIIKTNVPEFLM